MSDHCPKAPDNSGHHFVPRAGVLRCGLCGISQADSLADRSTVTFFITFGSQYRHEPHPKADFVHPDGWLEIVVPYIGSIGAAETVAREAANVYLDRAWAFIYDAESFDRSRHHYPMGCLARITKGAGAPQLQAFRHFRPRMEETP